MDFFNGFKQYWNQFSILSRIQTLPQCTFQKVRLSSTLSVFKNEKIRKRIQALLLFLTSAVFGLWANEYSQSEAKRQWEKSHLPSARVVEIALGSYEMRKVSSTDIIQRVLRKAPTHLDEPGSFWISSLGNWIIFFSDSENAIQAEVYCFICSDKADLQKWQPMGTGWSGLEKALDELKTKNNSKNIKKNSHRKVHYDSRELRY